MSDIPQGFYFILTAETQFEQELFKAIRLKKGEIKALYQSPHLVLWLLP